ncbi:hypothetical protein ACIRO3_25910 [Streptomyces sp. NPDC102278]
MPCQRSSGALESSWVDRFSGYSAQNVCAVVVPLRRSSSQNEEATARA